MIKISKLCEEFKKLGIELITGKDKAETKIDYITILELPEKNNNFKENGLVLSTFQAFKNVDNINEQINWIKELGILGIGFHQAHYKQVPDGVKQYCEKINMPLFSIPVNIPYHKILDTFNQLENEQLNLKNYEVYKMNDKILESVFLEKDPGYIVNLIGNYIKENIILLDPYMKVKAVWKEATYSQNYMDKLTSEITSVHKEKLLQTRFFKKEVQLTINDENNIKNTLNIIPMVSKKIFIGYIIINEKSLDNFYNEEIIRMGIRAIIMSANKQPSGNNHLKLRDIKKFEMLISNESNNLKENDFYIPVTKVSYCLRVLFNNKEILEETFNSLNTIFMEKNSNVLIWIYDETLIGYLENDEELNEFIEILKMHSFQSIGLSSKFKRTSLNDISKMNTQAKTAMLAAEENGEQLSKWDNIGIEKIVYNISELTLFKSLDDEILSPIIEYDRKKDGELMETLKSCLSNFFNIKAISEELFIHPNTVRYRLSQINKLLSIDINKSSNFALVVLAIKVHEKSN